MRPSGREPDALRAVTLDTEWPSHAEGACLISMGATRVLCTASVEDRLPPWMKGEGRGWVTAEYAMLPRATHSRGRREVTAGKQSGRTQEIQRLIGRSLRAVTDLEKLGERQITLDCDVLQADGGTRTAAITGAWVALRLAVDGLMQQGVLTGGDPLETQAAAVSCGIIGGTPVLDLDYDEDSTAFADANFVMDDRDRFLEIQATAEAAPFSRDAFGELMRLAELGIRALMAAQDQAIREHRALAREREST